MTTQRGRWPQAGGQFSPGVTVENLHRMELGNRRLSHELSAFTGESEAGVSSQRGDRDDATESRLVLGSLIL